MKRHTHWLVGFLAAACSGEVGSPASGPDASPGTRDAGAISMRGDAGSPPRPEPDAAMMPGAKDAAPSEPDANAPREDSGTAVADSGPEMPDSGPVLQDSGTAMADSGVPSSGDPHLDYALGLLNNARMMGGAAPLVLDRAMTACALRHATDLANCTMGGMSFMQCAHKDFLMGDTCGGFSENQGYGAGPEDMVFNAVFQQMMAEGPPPAGGDNHYWNIMNPGEQAVGIGIYLAPNGGVWISEDFR